MSLSGLSRAKSDSLTSFMLCLVVIRQVISCNLIFRTSLISESFYSESEDDDYE